MDKKIRNLDEIIKEIENCEYIDCHKNEIFDDYQYENILYYLKQLKKQQEIIDKNKYKTKCTTISGYCGKNYEENLKRFRDKLKKNDGHIDGIVTIKSIVIYTEKVEEE